MKTVRQNRKKDSRTNNSLQNNLDQNKPKSRQIWLMKKLFIHFVWYRYYIGREGILKKQAGGGGCIVSACTVSRDLVSPQI